MTDSAALNAAAIYDGWTGPDGDDDWLLRDALREHVGLTPEQVEKVAVTVKAWLETYAVAGIADVLEPLAELELK